MGECILIFLISSSVMLLKHVSVDVDCSSSSSTYDGTVNVFLFPVFCDCHDFIYLVSEKIIK